MQIYRPAPAFARPRRSQHRVPPVGRMADLCTLGAAFLVPNGGLAIGGTLGFAYGDVLFVLAVILRIADFATRGVPVAKLRHQSFLLGLVGAYCGWGLISGFVNGNPIAQIYVFMTFTLVSAPVLVATYGGDDRAKNARHIVTAFALGCIVLAASSYLSPTAQGRTIGLAIHPNAMGHTLIMGLALLMWLLDGATDLRQRLYWMGGIAVVLAGLMQSGSRGGILGIGVMVMLYLSLRGSFRIALVTLAGAWLALLLLFSGAVNLGGGNPLTRLFTDDLTSQFSDQERDQLREQNLEDIAEDPLFGKGWDEEIPNIHIVYFQGWVGGGVVPAFLLMLLGLTMLAMPFWQPRRELALACGAAGLSLAWIFTNIFIARDQWIFLALAFGQSPSPLALRSQIQSLRR